jgi:uncharacterized protein YkwD
MRLTKPGRHLVAVAAVAALTVGVLVADSAGSSAGTTLDPEEELMLQLINDWREENGAGPLTIDWKLQAASRWMSEDMAEKNYFSHTDSLGRSPFQRMADFGYTYNTHKGENLGAGNGSAQVIFDALRNSTGHNNNMLNANYKVIGVARAHNPDSDHRWYWTNKFGGTESETSPPAQSTPTPTPLPTPLMLGDIDCSGEVDAADSLLILREVAGSGVQVHCAGSMDVNCDGAVNALDALLVLRYAAGVPPPEIAGCAVIGAINE